MQFSRDSEWFAPLILGLGTAFVIILIVLLVFIAEPPLRDLSKSAQPVFDLSAEPVDLEIGRLKLRVPRNYIRRTEKASNNRIKELVLHALLPNMMSYQEKNWWMFEDKTPASRLVQMRFLHKRGRYDEAQRFLHVYDKQLFLNPLAQAPDGLTHYLFKQSANRPHEDVFTGKDRHNRRLLYLCFRPSALSVAPNCSRTFPFAEDVSLTYRFKRTHIENWREIDNRVHDLIKKFDDLARQISPKKPIKKPIS